jgi:hypothetical protein
MAGARVAFVTRCGGELLVLDDLNGCTCNQGDEPGHPSDRTKPDGSFSLDLVSCELFDSLTVAVVEPARVIMGSSYAVKDARQEDWNQQVPDPGTSYFFCATSTGFSTVRIGSVYSFSEETITMSPESGP